MSTPAPDQKPKSMHGVGQKMAIGANVVMTVLLAGVILVMFNYLAYRHSEWFWPPNWFTHKTDYRFDWTRSAYYKVTDKTKNIVRKLTQPVQILVFYKIETETDARIRNDLQQLLKEYEQLNKQISVQFIDVYSDPLAKQLIDKHQVTSANTVAILCGDKKKYLSESDIMDFSQGGNPMMPEPPKATAFKGEQAITGALLVVTEQKQNKIYFLIGHGEKDPTNFDEAKGYSTIASRLKQDNMLVENLKLVEKHKIPEDCDALVIAGPTKRLSAEELELVGQYLDNRGRLIVMLDPQTESGLEPLLEKWNVRLHNDIILAQVSLLGLQSIRPDAMAGDYSSHPIVDKLKDIVTYFPMARSLETIGEGGPTAEAPDKPKATWLVKTPEKGCWGETDFAALERRQAKNDAAVDKQAPLTLAVAVERGGNVSGVNVGASRIVVVGSSSFPGNRYVLEGANSDFFLNSINWLLQRQEASLGISPKTPSEFRFHIVGAQQTKLWLAILIGLPGLVAIGGIVVWMRRRR